MTAVFRQRVLHVLQETTPGTLATIGSAPHAVLDAFNCTFVEDTPFLAREGQHGFGAEEGTTGATAGTLTFSTHLFGAASTGWASLLLPACNVISATGGYVPRSTDPDAAASPTKCVSIFFFRYGQRHVLRGAMGTFVLNATAGERVRLDWTFSGICNAMTDVTLPAYTKPTALPIKHLSSALTIAAVTPKVAEFTFNLGNQVELQEDAADASGYAHAFVANRNCSGTILYGALLAATYDPRADMRVPTRRALSVAFGGSGNQVDLDAAYMQVTAVEEVERNGSACDRISYLAGRQGGTSGDNEFVIALS